MNNTVKTALFTTAIALFAAPAANAEIVPIEVTVEYDSNLLATEAGAADVMTSIKAQAKDACIMSRTLTTATIVDYDCVEEVVAKTVTKIQEAQIEQGREMARTFASLEGSLSSAPEQR